MSREIRFRAWDTRREMMIEEVYFFELNHNSDMEINPAERTKYRHYDDWRSLEDGIWKPCELMQFTGLKDVIGNPIYEGDIVKVNSPSDRREPFIAEVYYDLNVASFSGRVKGYPVDLFLHNPQSDTDFIPELQQFISERTIYVIGNIHQNPELL